jgi:hypothetical protein
MEVSITVLCGVRDSSHFQILPNHHVRFAFGKFREQWLLGRVLSAAIPSKEQ